MLPRALGFISGSGLVSDLVSVLLSLSFMPFFSARMPRPGPCPTPAISWAEYQQCDSEDHQQMHRLKQTFKHKASELDMQTGNTGQHNPM